MPTVLHNRHRAIAEIDRLIEEAERVQAAQQAESETIAPGGPEASRARELASSAAERLDLLRKSREILVSGDAGKRGRL